MRPFLHVLLVLVLAGALSQHAHALPDHERGRPLVRVHTMREFRGHAQLLSPSVGPDGFLYFGNQLAVLRWDGARWDPLVTPLPFARAATFGADGLLYLGDENALGTLTLPAPGAEPVYTSLLDSLPKAWGEPGLVRQIVRSGDAMLAVTDTRVLRITAPFAVLAEFPEPRRSMLLANTRGLWLARSGEGVHLLGDSGPRLVAALPPSAPAGARILLAPTADASRPPLAFVAGIGLCRLPESAETSSQPQPLRILENASVLGAPSALIRLRDGSLALGTADAGVRILSPDGIARRVLTRESGLPSDSVVALLEDRDGGLWVSTNNGPARVQLDSPVTLFDSQLGLPDTRSRSFARHNGRMHILTTDGLYVVEPSPAESGRPARVRKDERVTAQARLSSLLSHSTGLLFAGTIGLQRLTDTGTTIETLVEAPDGSWCVVSSPTEPDRIYVGLGDGVRTGRFDASGVWIDEGNIPGIQADSCAIHETPEGVLWIGTVSSGLFRAERGASGWKDARVTRLSTPEGLPEGHGMLFLYPGPAGLLVSTASGFYRATQGGTRLEAVAPWNVGGRTDLIFDPLSPGAPGELWTNGIAQSHDAPYPLLRLRFAADGSFEPTEAPPLLRALLEPFGANPILWERDPAGGAGVIWAKGEGPLLRIELDAYQSGRTAAAAPILRSLKSDESFVPMPATGQPVRLQDGAGLLLTLAPGNLSASDGLEFQYRLDPGSSGWTPWSRDPHIALVSLPAGRHTFQVRSREAAGEPGPAATLSLQIDEPWHRTPAAYGTWLLLAVFATGAALHVRTLRLRREQRRLEGLVAERTLELRAARDAAEQASHAKSAFLANMSHELRTPLNAILGYAQILLREPERSSRDRERLEVVNRSGEHLLRMINEVLDLSKIEAGRMELRPKPFDPGALVRDIAAAAEVRAATKGLRFTTHLPERLPSSVLGDPQKLRQILDNLLSNAVKFTQGGSVALDVSLQDTEGSDAPTWVFAVRDTGPGIAAAEHQSVFEPFAQARSAATTQEAGTGLGLPISLRFAKLMGGTLELESTPGAGSLFTLRVPLEMLASANATAERGASSAPFQTGYAGARRTVLVADDLPVNRAVLRDLLTPLGFQVIEASNGEEALARHASQPADLVLMDLRMPVMDGLTCTRALRSQNRDGASPAPRILALSASVIGFTRDDALAAGCDDFLGKPFQAGELLDRIGRLLGIEWINSQTYAAASVVAPATARVPDSEVLSQIAYSARVGDVGAVRALLTVARASKVFTEEDQSILETLAATFQIGALRAKLEQLTTARR